MFSKETYVRRRAELKRLVKSGVVILFGNNESPVNYPSNGYYPFRQDSSFLYYFGLNRDGLVGVIDIDEDKETIVGNDIDIEDIVWLGSVDSVSDMAASTGVGNTAPMKHLQVICNDALRQHRPIHFLPPYRHDTKLQIFDLLGIHPNQQKEAASLELINAVVKMRSTKEAQEIEEIEGKDKVEEIKFKDGTTIKTEGIFVAEGVAGSSEFAKKLGIITQKDKIVVNENMETNVKGIYACGDCTGGLLQVSKAVHEGTKAGLEVIKRQRGI